LTERIRAIAGPSDLRQLHREHPTRYPFLLQSTAHSGVLGRFDILFAFPGETIEADSDSRFLDDLDSCWRQERIAPIDSELPFHGGWFVYLGYELAAQIETGLSLQADTVLPAAFAVRCPIAVIYDHAEETCWLVAEPEHGADLNTVHDDVAALNCYTIAPAVQLTKIAEEPGDRFKSAVVSAKEYIAAGDVYQANLSREWSATAPASICASDIYDVLCRSNPGPFAGMARWHDTAIISSSPERDDSLSAELFAHPKERAEHIMLIDLERNDLGRVCRAGTVEVDEMMVLESYAHVHHIVSNVRGELHDGVTPGQAIAAVFPGGTITGCPKVRCMEIISELEQGPRGAYTGSFGYLNRDGSLDLNILIRTLVKEGRNVTFRAGSGIVADSDPQAELEETRAKAKGLLRAISG